MESVHKCVVVFSAWIVWIFALTAALAWYTFGYVDLLVVREMVLLLLPLLGAAVVVLLWSERSSKSFADETAPDPPHEKPRTAKEVRHVDVR